MGPSSSSASFHRWEDDYLTADEWGDALRFDERVALALGPEPLEDARHLLPPIRLPERDAPPEAAQGPNPATEFLLDLRAPSGTVSPADILSAFPAPVRAALDFPRLWAQRTMPGGAAVWQPVEEIDPAARFANLTLAWELTTLVGEESGELARHLSHLVVAASRAALPLGLSQASAREEAREAARRTLRLREIREKYARAVEMRLIPAGRSFPSRDVWRGAYSLGLQWGDMDLLHWDDPATGTRLFTVSGAGQPGYFLPERAAEGEGVAGIALAFELPFSPAPLVVYDRMAVALSYFRQRLGGRPTARDGAELDADRLYDDRDALEEAIAEMARAGIAPGSAEAARFF